MLNEFREAVYDVKTNFTKEEKAEYVALIQKGTLRAKQKRAVLEYLDPEEFLKQELFIVGKQNIGNYAEDKVVDVIKKKYSDGQGFYLYSRGYIQGVRTERARRKASPFYGVKQSIYSMIDDIHTKDDLIRIHRFIQVLYIHKKAGEIVESTKEDHATSQSDSG